jgi:endonuclease YncB( thermonuclease family)
MAKALITIAAVVLAAFIEPRLATADVIDGATIEIRGERIRLHGIDAPESGYRRIVAVCFAGNEA